MVDYKRMHAKLKNLYPEYELFDPTTIDYDQWFAVMQHLLTVCKSPRQPNQTPIADGVAWHTYMLAVVWHPSELVEKASDYLTQFHVEYFNLLPPEMKRAFSDQQRLLGDDIGEYWLYNTYKKYVLDSHSLLMWVNRVKEYDVLPFEDLDQGLWGWAAQLLLEELQKEPRTVKGDICNYVWSLYELLDSRRAETNEGLIVQLHEAIRTAFMALGEEPPEVVPVQPREWLLSQQRYMDLRQWMLSQEQTRLAQRLKLPIEKGLLHDGR